ncbi:MAG: hypothetical protein JOS17DRAFT_765181 [Linnemannia elongata]|nr:MAG: hypothetical protein JOS17DRAFT_765181 [Linnemannia elongata]
MSKSRLPGKSPGTPSPLTMVIEHSYLFFVICVFFPTVCEIFQLYPVIQLSSYPDPIQFSVQFYLYHHSAAHFFSSGSEGCEGMYLCVFYACVCVCVFSFFPAIVLIMFLSDQLAVSA